MNASADHSDSTLGHIDPICDAFEAAHKAGKKPRIEDFVGDVPDSLRCVLLRHLLLLQLEYGWLRGEQPSVEEYVRRFPHEQQVVVDAFHDFECERQQTVDERARVGLQIRCPHCHIPVEIAADMPFEDIACSSCGSHFSLAVDSTETEDASQFATIGHFELIERLGIGGFGTVWKARDTQLDRTVAIKIPRQGRLGAEELQKFFREARSAAQLMHPNIVGVHEVGRDGDAVYIVSDLVRGVSLSNWLSGKSMTVREAAEFCAKIADALDHAHENNVVHRDLKPHNIIVDKRGEPHLTDFGLAKRETGEITMTLDGQVLGTPAYMPPEQASGGGHTADRRADIYSLGVILFQLISAELPFRGNRDMLIHQVLHEEPPSPRRFNGSIPRDLETICLKCLAKERTQRYSHASDLAADLRHFLRGEPIQARPVRRITRVARWCKRNPTISGLLFAVFLSLIVGFMVSSFFAWTARSALREVARSEAAKTKALTDALLSSSRAIRRARPEGYRQEVYRIIQQALDLGALQTEEIEVLRHEAVGAMGDFVGLPPTDYEEFSSDISSIGFHPRADFFAVGYSDGTVRLFQPRTGTVIEELTRHDHAVVATAIDPAGRILVSADTNGQILFHAPAPGRDGHWAIERTLEIGGRIESIHLGEDCEHLVARSASNVKIWDLTRGTEIATYTPQQLLIHSAVVSTDKTLLVVGYEDEQTAEHGIIVWNVRERKEEHRIPLNFGNAYPHSMAFSPDGKLFAYGCDQALIIYEVPSFNRLSLRRTDAIIAAAFSPDSQSLVSLDIRGGIAVWSATTGERTASLSHRRSRPSYHWLAFSADGTHLASASADSVRTWNLAGAPERRAFEGHGGPIPSLAYSPNGDRVASASKDHTVSFWDPLTSERVATLPGFPGEVQCVAYTPNGRQVATAHWAPDNSIQIWDVTSLRLIGSITHDLGPINRLAFAGDALRLAAAGDKGIATWEVDIQDVDGPRAVLKPGLSKSGVKCRDITWSSDGRLLAWPNDQTHIQVWDFEIAGYRDVTAPRMLQAWHGLVFLPNSHQLAFVNMDGGLQIWDAFRNTSCFVSEVDRFQAPHLALTTQGSQLAGLVGPDTVGVWDLNSHKQLFALRSERTAIWSLAWSPDGTQLAVGLSDGGLAVWDLQRIRQELASLGLPSGTSPK